LIEAGSIQNITDDRCPVPAPARLGQQPAEFGMIPLTDPRIGRLHLTALGRVLQHKTRLGNDQLLTES
jgi:hypothetical protein